MSARIKILAPVTNKDSLLDALNQLSCVSNIHDDGEEIIRFTLNNIEGRHAFVLEGEQWNLQYEDYRRVGNGMAKGQEFLSMFMPVYNKIQEERHAEELRQLVKKKEEEITAKAKANNYRVVRKEEQGKIKLVLVRPGRA